MTGPLAGFMWLALGIWGICRGPFGKEFRKGDLVKARLSRVHGGFFVIGSVGAYGEEPVCTSVIMHFGTRGRHDLRPHHGCEGPDDYHHHDENLHGSFSSLSI